MNPGAQPSIPKPVPPPIPQSVPPPIPKAAPPPTIAKPRVPSLLAASIPPGPQTRPAVLVKAKKLTRWDVIFRFLVFIFIVASIALAWWSYSERLVPLQKQSLALTSANSLLSADVDKMDRKWSKEEIELVRASYNEAYSTLFADEAALQDWLLRLEKKALPLALDVKVNFGKGEAQLTNDDKLAIVPAAVALQVHPMPGGRESPYQRLLRLGEELAAEGKRSDLAELTAVGGVGSITNATLVFNLWAGEEKKKGPK
jgi:hypothetical protein